MHPNIRVLIYYKVIACITVLILCMEKKKDEVKMK